MPADDAGDLDIIRHDWIRRRALAALGLGPATADTPLSAGSPDAPADAALAPASVSTPAAEVKGDAKGLAPAPEWTRLRVHVGTFNVNGKLPADGLDVRPWLGLPPARAAVQASKPVPVGAETVLPPIPAVSPLSMRDVPAEQAAAATAGTQATAGNTVAPGDGARPDLVVLAFQELDLSTSALIYAAERSREEAWARVALEALNDGVSDTSAGDGYEKVGGCVHV
jgi:phosphatidylinositol-bisphosphatase